jgi:hypothetical protein
MRSFKIGILQALFGKSAAGMGFEVFFEVRGFFKTAKSDSRFNSPGAIF